jgi:hypothetical protein
MTYMDVDRGISLSTRISTGTLISAVQCCMCCAVQNSGGRQFMMAGPSTVNRQARHAKSKKCDWLIFGGVDD